MEATFILTVIDGLGTVTKGLIKGLEDIGNKQTSGDYLNCYIIENGQNTEKSPKDSRRLAVT